MRTFLALLFLSIAGIHPVGGGVKAKTNQIQQFEDSFTLVNDPQEFLPGWTGNDVRSTATRIFQSTLGRNGSIALAAQPISSFNAVITVRLFNSDLSDPKVQFWAKSVQNGTGTRAAEIFYSWKGVSQSNFSGPQILEGSQEFPNETQEFKKYRIDVPDDLKGEAELILKIEVRYGSGTGNAARWVMDDFEFGDFEEDLSAPLVNLVRGYDEKIVELIFNEELDLIFSTFILNYELEGLALQKAELKNDSLVYLFSNESLIKGQEYKLKIRQIPDLEGNFMKDTLVTFTFSDPTEISLKGLVINEIMPAPKADLDLPNVEYVELFNASDQDLRLDDLVMANSRTSASLPVAWLAPGEYLILTPENQALSLAGYGRVLPLKNWPTLLNSGDVITLSKQDGKVVDQLSYVTGSWKGSEFANGAYSLEVINPFYSCDQSILLQTSKDPLRGTPGKQNSMFSVEVDLEKPTIIRSFFRDESSIILEFSKPIFPSLNEKNFSIEPELPIAGVIFEKSNRILVRLNSPALANSIYKLSFIGILDCGGNSLDQNKTTELVLPLAAKIGDLIINEMLFNPKTGFPKFVEIQNTTTATLEFSSWQLASLDDTGNPVQVKVLGEENLQISPKGFAVFTSNSSLLLSAYPDSDASTFYQLSALPSYTITEGDVVLLDGNSKISEIFSYSEDLHHPLLRDPKGVSLERISSSTPVNTRSNWHSASGIAGYATPGRKNSQFISAEYDGNIIQIEPEVFDPEGSAGNTFTSIKYELEQAGWIGSFRIYSISGQLIQSLAQNEILGARGLFTWTGTDSFGKIVRPGYYILLVELFDLSGNLKSIKKTLIVATRF
ncbi:MAG: hypothetical protein ACI9UV_002111 [Algoriphagus sp.]|jgi:hypothetical protein